MKRHREHWTEHISGSALIGLLFVALMFFGASILPERARALRGLRFDDLMHAGPSHLVLIAIAGVGLIVWLWITFTSLIGKERGGF